MKDRIGNLDAFISENKDKIASEKAAYKGAYDKAMHQRGLVSSDDDAVADYMFGEIKDEMDDVTLKQCKYWINIFKKEGK